MGGDDVAAGILRTKLYAPRLPDIIPREKLLHKLDAARSAKLTTMVAGAGYGKSTLAAAFLAARKAPSVWYQLEKTDRDLSEFVTYLVAGIRMHESGFGEKTIGRLRETKNITGESQAIFSTLISEIDAQIKEDLFIVLDDFQEVNESSQVTGALDFLLGHMPPHLHLIILSRVKPDLDLSGLAAHRELVEIKEADLSFSPRETSQLFTEVFGLPLEDEDAKTLCEHTEGWITGLVLFWLAVKDRGEEQMRDAARDLAVPPARVAEYLSDVAFESQSEAVREFSVKTSILTRMNPGFCDQLLGIGDSGAILDHLFGSRMFTVPMDDRGDWYRYHHLLRSFLREKLSGSCSRGEVIELNLKAAGLWEEYGEPGQALSHYLEAGDFDSAAAILNSLAPGLMSAGRISLLNDNLNRLPEGALFKHPWLVFDLAKISDLMGEYAAAISYYQAAAALFGERGDFENHARSLINIGFCFTYTGKPEEATDYLTMGIGSLPPDSNVRRKAAAILSFEYTLRGVTDASLRFQSEALEGIDGMEDEASRVTVLSWCAYASFNRGNYTQAYGLYLRAIELAERIGLDVILPYIYGSFSFMCSMKGRYGEALEYADKGLSQSEKFGFTNAVLRARINRALALALMGDREQSLRDIGAAISLSKGLGPGYDAWSIEYIAGWVYMCGGHHAESIRHLVCAERLSEQFGFRFLNLCTRLFIIWQSPADLDIDAAVEEVKAISAVFEDPGIGTYLFCCYLVLALLEVIAGREDGARGALEASLEQAAPDDSIGVWRLVWSGEEAHRLLPLAAEMFSRGEHLDYLGCAFSSVGKASAPYLQKLTKSKDARVREKAREIIEVISRETAEPLKIRMLGTFEVERGGKRIAEEDWRSKRALAVMKYLASQEERRFVPRDVLMELLWPGSSPEAASKSLNVALTALRRTLEPEGVKGDSSYLVSSGDSLRLELGKGGCIDIRRFWDDLSRAAESRDAGEGDLYLARLREAEELYRGDFLAEDLYEDWCRPERERLYGEYLDLLLDICNEYLERENAYSALHYAVKATQADPGREDLYRRLMEIYSRMGDRAGVERAFKRISSYLKEEFDVDPSPETVELYHRLREDRR
jgi:ATP/maltotriose-dependent transcriptional regulator MalT/DNA-binding SARP family transcriptional activator